MSGSTVKQNNTIDNEQNKIYFEHQPESLVVVVSDEASENPTHRDVYRDYDPLYTEANNRLSPLWRIS